MLEAAHDGADWRDVSRIVLHIDPDADASRARHAFDSHMIRARWMTTHGFLLLPNPLERTGAPTFDPAISCPPRHRPALSTSRTAIAHCSRHPATIAQAGRIPACLLRRLSLNGEHWVFSRVYSRTQGSPIPNDRKRRSSTF